MRHVLIADDDIACATALGRFLERRGYAVTMAADGQAALQCHRRNPADLLVTDMRMPRMGGGDLIQHLWAENPNLPILVITGFSAEVQRFQDGRGPLRVLHKPVDVKDLLVQIRALSAAKDDAPP